ncbi:MAG: TIGR00730 family Rossman fold protein [Dehalococcoidia bacterium]|nr:TIGR00730 family Rossman fold protein [Dehalococcoidia bacterium]
MPQGYEINDFAKEESWRMFRIMGEMVGGFDKLSDVEPAITIYGSARVSQEDALYATTEEIANRLGKLGFSIITGGGPGVMEAANKGALDAGVQSIGLNIELPEEQSVNPYTTLSITFNHFFARKVMLAKYASAFIIMPGGLGTLDEVTEILCLIQTHKMRPFPVILFDSSYWAGFVDWMKKCTLPLGYVDDEDLKLLVMCNDVDHVVETVSKWREQQGILTTPGQRRRGRNPKPNARSSVPSSPGAGQKENPK